MGATLGGTKGARIFAASGTILLALLMPAAAQAPGPGDAHSGDAPAAAPSQTIIGGQPPPPPNYQRCTEVEIGGDREFGCLNLQLKREVERVNPSTNSPPFDARSPDVSIGIANDAAVREQYGPNYGRSVVPYRPPTPPPVTPHH